MGDVDDRHNRRVLIIDDQQEIHADFAEMLKPRLAAATDRMAATFGVAEPPRTFLPEFELLHASNGEDGYAIVKQGQETDRPVAVVFVDIRMSPGMDGVETIRRMRKVDPDMEAVIMTAYTDKPLSEIVTGMESLHRLLYIRKPVAREEVQQITLCLIEKWNVERDLDERRRQLVSSHRRLEAVLNATGDAIAMWDPAEGLVFVNRWYEKLVDANRDELQRMTLAELDTHYEQRFREPELNDEDYHYLTVGRESVVERIVDGSWREPRQFYRRQSVVRDEHGEELGNLYVYRDVSRELEAERMKAEVARLRSELATRTFPEMVGSAATMHRLYALMGQAVEHSITVLILGESGTGKELVARALHLNGPRRMEPFLAINCAAVPEALIESELFGHEAGAFTGAAQRRIGVFERAGGGTILLDEVGDMPPPLQAKLLRVLQEREIQRVGGTEAVPVDVRVIAATNQDLEAAVNAGRFREDLYYRLAAFPVVVPPLRERREDIPLLAQHLMQKHAMRSGKRISSITSAALRMLQQYHWPGNVRELENAMGRAVLGETTDVLQASSLPSQLLRSVAAGADHPAAPRTLAEVERAALSQALTTAAGNVTAAAQALGINRATLYRKLKRHELSVQG